MTELALVGLWVALLVAYLAEMLVDVSADSLAALWVSQSVAR